MTSKPTSMSGYALADHDAAVRSVSFQVSNFHKKKIQFRINHGSTNSTRTRTSNTPTVDIAHLNNIIFISDPLSSTCHAVVEPNVPLDALVEACLPLGLVPPVVMEFPGITVGGGFSGASGESSSFKHGLFDCTILAVEIVLASGEVVRAEKMGKNSGLFDTVRCSLGTIGVVTLLQIQLVKAKEFVRNQYISVDSVDEMISELKRQCNRSDVDYVEGIMFSPTSGAAMTGKLVDRNEDSSNSLPIQRFSRAWDPWFYLHAQQKISSTGDDLIPLQDYLFRYDRGAFWSGRTFFKYFSLPFNRFFRALCNPLLTTRAIYKAQQATGSADEYIVQDVVVPLASVTEFVNYVDKELEIWPIWFCPVRRSNEDVVLAPFRQGPKYEKEDLYINLGVWGEIPERVPFTRSATIATNRGLEAALAAANGMKVLYAQVFYTESEFWAQFDKEKYEKLRKQWGANGTASVWDKVKMKTVREEAEDELKAKEKDAKRVKGLGGRLLAIWPLAGLYQCWKVLRG